MSRSIDERIVEMQFNNRQFESGIKDSLHSIDRLKSGLNFDESVKSLSSLSDAGKKFSLAGIAEGVDTIAGKFTTLGIIGVTALQNITNSAVNFGKQIVASLTIEPITTGFSEYELKMGSIQTIMAGTGESLQVVNQYLAELNAYADKTIYSFADMTTNIGKFTNAGVSLEGAVAAIQGVANVAAVSGANAEEASRAMYNFAQALSAGYVKLVDWKSIELANMGTKEFKQQLIDAAVAAGTLTATADGLYKTLSGNVVSATRGFNESLQDQWMTTEVLVNTLGKYSDETTDIGKKAFAAAQDIKTLTQMYDTLKEAAGSGWAESWEIIAGNFDEAKELFTELGETIGGFLNTMATARNEMLLFWKDNGGRVALIDSFRNAFDALGRIVTPIKEAFRDFFPPMTGEKLLAITEGIKSFTERIKIGEETSEKIKRTFAGLFAVIDLVGEAFGFVFNVATELFGLFGGPAANGILTLTAYFGDFLVKLNESITQGDRFKEAFEKVRDVFTTIADKIKDAVSRISVAISSFKDIDLGPLELFSDTAETHLKPFESFGKIFAAAFEAIVKVLEWGAPIVFKLGEIASGALSKLAETVGASVENLDFKDILELINGGLFAAILLGIRNFIKSLTDISSSAGGFLDGITGILDGVRGSLEAYQNNLKAKTLLTIAIAIGILAVSLAILSSIDGDKLTNSLMAITILFTELSVAMIVLQKSLMGVKIAGISLQMVAIATAILILSAAMKKLAELDWEGIAKGTIGIAALCTTLVASAKLLSGSKGPLIKGATSLIAFSAAILIMAQAVKNLAGLSWEELARGLTGLTVVLVEVIALTNLIGSPKRMISTGLGLIALSASMVIFAEAIEKMGELAWGEIARGLTAMAGALAAITVAMNLMPKGMIGKATGMVVISAAMIIFAEVVERFSALSWGEIARGLTAMAGALTAITLALNFMPKGIINKAIGLIGVATALVILSKALKTMGQMSWEEVAKGLITLGGSMLILAVALNVMQRAIPGALAMLIIAPALLLMAQVLKTLGSLSIGEIVKGLASLAGIFIVLGAAALVLQPLVPTILALGLAITLLGTGIALVGIGVLAFSAGLTALAVSATAAAGAIVIIGSAVLSLIPLFFEKIGEGILALGNTIINGAPIIKEAFLVLLDSAIEALVEATPMIAEGLMSFVLSLLTVIDDNLPTIIDKLFSIVTGFIEKLTEKLPELIRAGAELLGAFLEGIFNAMGGYQPENLFNLITCITMLVAAFAILAASRKLAKDAIVAVGMMAVVMAIIVALFVVISCLDIENTLEIALSLSTVLLAISASMVILSLIPVPAALSAVAGLGVFVAGMAVLLTALGALAQIPGLEWLMGEGAQMLGDIGHAIGAFAGNIIGGFLNGVSGSFPQIGEDLSAFMENVTPFIEGAKNIDPAAMDGVKALAETVLILTAASVLDGLTSWLTGGSSMAEFGKELNDFAPYFVGYYNQIKDVDGAVVEASANAALALAEFANNIPNSGGLLAKITGENSISSFADELAVFGPKLLAYSQSIQGLDSDVVMNSANAALALAEMADKLPNSGGLLAKITGDNSISAFADELVIFGPKLMEYAQSVAGLDASVVINSANAAAALSALADGLPNSEGLVALFTGENKLSTFGEELSIFGPYLKAYADSVTGLDANVVTNSANAAAALKALSDGLPNSGGLVSFFTGDNTMADFGEQIAEFGRYFAEYYDNISDINTSQMDGVIEGIETLVNLAKDITSADISGLSTFAQDLAAQADLGIEGFTSAFEDAGSKVKTAIGSMFDVVTNSVTAEKPNVVSKMTIVVTAMLNVLTIQTPQFKTATYILMSAIQTSITDKQTVIVSTLTTVISAMVTAGKNKRSDWVAMGGYLVDGFVVGINNAKPRAITAAANMAAAALDAAMDAIGAASPAKKTIEMGKYFDDGFAIGLARYAYLAENSARDLGNNAVDGINNAIRRISETVDAEVDINPTIRPILDMTDVTNGLNSAFKNSPNLNVSAIAFKASRVSTSTNDGKSPNAINNETDNSDNSTIQITNHFVVRNDSDVQKISRNLSTILDRYRLAKGVTVK